MTMFDIQRLKKAHFPPDQKATSKFLAEVHRAVSDGMVVLDAGCGRSAPILVSLPATARRIGIDLVEPCLPPGSGVEFLHRGMEDTGLPSAFCDLVISRSVLEHLAMPELVFAEIARVLKPGGRFVFVTPNGWDYVSILARVVPNRWHPVVVARAQGRSEDDVFPVLYRANTARALRRLSQQSGLTVQSLEYLGSQPSYLKFSSTLYAIGTVYELVIRRFRLLHPLRGWILGSLVKPAVDLREALTPEGQSLSPTLSNSRGA